MIRKSELPKLFILFVLVSVLFLNLGITPLFATTNTKVQEFVKRFYTQALERQPDTAGLNSWVSQLTSSKITGAQFASDIIFSAEFSSKDINNKEFVNILFRSCYNREPDAASFDSWVNLLDTGQSRQFVLAGFTNSEEFKNICTVAGIKAGQLDPGAGLPPGIILTSELKMVATAYLSGGRTATGLRARKGIAAVDPGVIPLGTKLYIEGYGEAQAADIGSSIKGNRIDLCFDSLKECKAFGKRNIIVYLVEN
jgi:3D (Asp-Asp-Asp) domain-containing protein